MADSISSSWFGGIWPMASAAAAAAPSSSAGASSARTGGAAPSTGAGGGSGTGGGGGSSGSKRPPLSSSSGTGRNSAPAVAAMASAPSSGNSSSNNNADSAAAAAMLQSATMMSSMTTPEMLDTMMEMDFSGGGFDYKTMSDDEVADRLLTQFPAYGSVSSSAQNSSYPALSSAHDWFGVATVVAAATAAKNSGGSSRVGAGAAAAASTRSGGAAGGEGQKGEAFDDDEIHHHGIQHNAAAGGGGRRGVGKDSSSKAASSGGGSARNAQAATADAENVGSEVGGGGGCDWDPDERTLWTSSSSMAAAATTTAAATAGGKDARCGAPGGTARKRKSSQQPNSNSNKDDTGDDRQRKEWILGGGGGGGAGPGGEINTKDSEPKGATAASSSAANSTRRSMLLRMKSYEQQQHISSSFSTSATTAAGSGFSDRQHWMPDQLCKQCYDCDVPFTVFRRRHHCRLCGQVFCNACSAYFVRQNPKSNMTIRVCRMCNDQVAQKGGLILDHHHQQQQQVATAASDEVTAAAAAVDGNGALAAAASGHAAGSSANASKEKSKDSTPANNVATATAAAGAAAASGSPDRRDTANSSRKRCHLLSDHILMDVKSPTKPADVKSSDSTAVDMVAPAAAAAAAAPAAINVKSNSVAVFNALSQSKRLLLTSTVNSAAALSTPSPQQVQDLEEQERLQLVELEHQHPHHDPPPTPKSMKMKRNASNASLSSTLSKNFAAAVAAATAAGGSGASAGTSSCSSPSDAQDEQRKGKIHLGLTAANHLEVVARDLLQSHAPLLFQQAQQQHQGECSSSANVASEKEGVEGMKDGENKTKISKNQENKVKKEGEEGDVAAVDDHQDEVIQQTIKKLQSNWVNQLLTLATRCCSTVEPNVKKGDLLDIRPYVKVKTVPGSSLRDCAYMSGVVFRKTVSHKRMAKQINNPRVLLLSGGIEFTRTENRIASLETLFEQEEKYMEILVSKILKLKPDVLLVGRSVSRRGQELLLKAGVVLIQHVKSSLLSRIARQTGATVISSTDHYMSQFGPDVLGKCRRFRLVTFRDNEVWTDEQLPAEMEENTDSSNKSNRSFQQKQQRRSIEAMLADPKLSIPERQAALAASKLGQGVLDGSEAVKSGLAKRGVAQTYVLLEGCPKHLGCTVVLRGANRAALKQLKVVFRFLVNVAYNLRLETSYLRERGARIRPDFQEVGEKYSHSTSLCVDYGQPLSGKKIRPWNGGTSDKVPRLDSGEVTAFDHQSILITSVWMTEKTQCCPAEVKGICYYSLQDVALGQFLRDSCFNLSLKCQNPNCKKSVLDHSLSFVHNDGLINITVEELDDRLPPSPLECGIRKDGDDDVASVDDDDDADADRPIATWTYCKNCRKVVTPLVYISDSTWKFSFGKFLEVFFYNRDAIMNAPEYQCSCQVQSATRLYFGCGKLAARFNYEAIRPFNVFVRRSLPIETSFLKEEALRRLELVTTASSKLFIKFDRHIDRVASTARSLFNSPVNRPEHLQTVLLELKRIGSDVDHAAKTLQDKIASVTESYRQQVEDDSINEALFQFPWFARRYLFMLTSAWNEKLSATGQAISAMKRIAASSSSRNDGVIGSNVTMAVGDPASEALMESMKRLRKLNETYARYSVTDITEVLPSLPGVSEMQQDGDYDDEFDDPETPALDFSDGVDADVLASRRRLQSKSFQSQSPAVSRPRPTKSLGTRRNDGSRPSPSGQESVSSGVSVGTSTSASTPQKTTAGGAVKSALNRFFNRGGNPNDNYTVDLGIFAEGRPRLSPGVDGVVVAVYDEQLSTIIAYSLASAEYAKQFKYFSKHEPSPTDVESSAGTSASQRSRMGSSDGGASAVNDKRQRPAEPPNTGAGPHQSAPPPPAAAAAAAATAATAAHSGQPEGIERRMLVRSKSHIKHTFRDFDEKGQVTCKFVCTTYWATQFHAVRQVFLSRSGKVDSTSSSADSDANEVEQGYVESLSSAYMWNASGGKSGASFHRTSDDRLVIKCISRTELQMFLDCAPAYFEYLSKAFFHGLPTVLCKIVGVYQIGVHNRITGKRSMEQVAVMQNIFYGRNTKITRVFDLKGSLRGRFAANIQQNTKDESSDAPSQTQTDTSSGKRSQKPDAPSSDDATNRETEENAAQSTKDAASDDDRMELEPGPKTLLDGDFLEFTLGRPMPMTDRAKAVFQMSILNDTLFLSIINVLDYSILVGVDEESHELVVGIIDFMRQYDILKQMERVGKSLPMVVGSEAPTIIQPPLYKARFTNAMERYFMTVPSKWTIV